MNREEIYVGLISRVEDKLPEILPSGYMEQVDEKTYIIHSDNHMLTVRFVGETFVAIGEHIERVGDLDAFVESMESYAYWAENHVVDDLYMAMTIEVIGKEYGARTRCGNIVYDPVAYKFIGFVEYDGISISVERRFSEYRAHIKRDFYSGISFERITPESLKGLAEDIFWRAEETEQKMKHDPVHSPEHYTHPTGIECKEITYDLPTWLGSAIKYIWRADKKGRPIQDREKAIECLNYATIDRVKVLGASCAGLDLDSLDKIADYEWRNGGDLCLNQLLRWIIKYIAEETDPKYFLEGIEFVADMLTDRVRSMKRGEEDD